jgi:hypothetical protein
MFPFRPYLQRSATLCRHHSGGRNGSLANSPGRRHEKPSTARVERLRAWRPDKWLRKLGAAGLCNGAECAPEACREVVAGNERWRTLSVPCAVGQPVDTPPFGKYFRMAGVHLPGFIARARPIRRAACDQNLHGLRLHRAGPIAGHVARTVPGAHVKVFSYVCFFRQAPLRAH